MSNSSAPAPYIPPSGTILAGKYRVERVLGRGGMGYVLAATHMHLDEPVALKLLNPAIAQDPDLVTRFLREGKAATKIRSEHVVRVLDVGTLEDGSPYMVMECLEGSDLEAMLSRSGQLGIEQTVDYVLQACEALAEAHVQGMVHRDLKPANLFVSKRADGTPLVKVLDFGISKVTGAGGADLGMTKTSAVMGSPRYMSPEQMRSTRRVDARADIWALGTILHEVLTGAPPFNATTMPELCATILQDPAPPLRQARPDAPAALEAAVQRCLEKEPSNRFEHVGALAMALAPFASMSGRTSVSRVIGVLQTAGVQVSAASALPASPLAMSSVSTGPLPTATGPASGHAGTGTAWGKTGGTSTSASTTAHPSLAARTAIVAGSALGLLALLGIVVFVVFSRRPSTTTSASSEGPPIVSVASPGAPPPPTAPPIPPPSAATEASPAASEPAPTNAPDEKRTTKPTAVAPAKVANKEPILTRAPTPVAPPPSAKPPTKGKAAAGDLFDNRL